MCLRNCFELALLGVKKLHACVAFDKVGAIILFDIPKFNVDVHSGGYSLLSPSGDFKGLDCLRGGFGLSYVSAIQAASFLEVLAFVSLVVLKLCLDFARV